MPFTQLITFICRTYNSFVGPICQLPMQYLFSIPNITEHFFSFVSPSLHSLPLHPFLTHSLLIPRSVISHFRPSRFEFVAAKPLLVLHHSFLGLAARACLHCGVCVGTWLHMCGKKNPVETACTACPCIPSHPPPLPITNTDSTVL